jgi:hypothetical protein
LLLLLLLLRILLQVVLLLVRDATVRLQHLQLRQWQRLVLHCVC